MTAVEATDTVLVVDTAAEDSRRGETIESQPDGQFKAVEGKDDFVRFQVGMTFDDIEREMLLKTLAYHDNNKRKAARTLGITTKTIYNRLLRYRHQGFEKAS